MLLRAAETQDAAPFRTLLLVVVVRDSKLNPPVIHAVVLDVAVDLNRAVVIGALNHVDVARGS